MEDSSEKPSPNIEPKGQTRPSDRGVELPPIAGGARFDDLPKGLKAEVDKIESSAGRRVLTPEIDQLLLKLFPKRETDLATMTPEQKMRLLGSTIEPMEAESLAGEPETGRSGERAERVRRGFERGGTRELPRNLGTIPELEAGRKNQISDLVNLATDASVVQLSDLVRDGTFLQVREVKKSLDGKRKGLFGSEVKDFQVRYRDLSSQVEARLKELERQFESAYPGGLDDITKQARDIESQINLLGWVQVDPFVEDRQRGADFRDTPEKLRGVRLYIFETISERLRSSAEKKHLYNPSDTPSEAMDKLLRQLDIYDESDRPYQEIDPQHSLDTFIRSQTDSDLRLEMQAVYKAREVFNTLKSILNNRGGNLDELQKIWRVLGSHKEVRDINGVPREVDVSDLAEVLKLYPGAGRATFQFAVEADVQLNETDKKVKALVKPGQKILPHEVEILKAQIDWTQLLMSYTPEAKERAMLEVARKLGLDVHNSKDRASLELAYSLFRIYMPAIFDGGWHFNYRDEGEDRVGALRSDGPYMMEKLENPFVWLYSELRGKFKTADLFEKIMGPKVYEHLKIGRRALRNMLGGCGADIDLHVKKPKDIKKDIKRYVGTEEWSVDVMEEVAEQRESGEDAFFTEMGGIAERVNGELVIKEKVGNLDWDTAIASLRGADWADDLLDDSIKEEGFYNVLQRHVQKMGPDTLAELIKELPSGKEFRWQGRLKVAEILRHYIEGRRRWDKSVYDRDRRITVVEADKLIKEMTGSYMTKTQANDLRHELLGIGVGKVRAEGVLPVKWVRRMMEGLDRAGRKEGLHVIYLFTFGWIVFLGRMLLEEIEKENRR